MFRQTPFDTATIRRSVVARRKGTDFRLFDPVTARMSGWMKGPKADPKPVADYARLTVKELFTLARSKFGMRVTTKTRKAELVRMLTSEASKGF